MFGVIGKSKENLRGLVNEFGMVCNRRKLNVNLSKCKVVIIIIISQTATQTGRAASYTPKGASRVSSPVRKMKR